MDWLRRNRRKLAIGGGVIGGLYIVGRWVINLKNHDLSQLVLPRLAERQLVKAREAETALLVITTQTTHSFHFLQSFAGGEDEKSKSIFRHRIHLQAHPCISYANTCKTGDKGVL